jgi:Helix-turn-helix domain
MTSEYARQNAMVFDHLRTASITPKEALNLYGCFRLAARIYDLRQFGHEIITLRVRNDEGNPYAEYHMVRQARR